ncbi:DUF4838 domain-containing protein [bacterium]
MEPHGHGPRDVTGFYAVEKPDRDDNGKRFSDRQLCLTHPDVLKIVSDRVVEHAESYGNKQGIITVSQMDNVYPCMCDTCRAQYAKDGTQVDTYIRFVNTVADAIAEKFPKIKISTLAYNFTEESPKVVKPRPNVIVRLCHMSPSCDLDPLEDCLLNARFMDNLKKWNELSDNLYIWHYITVFHNYLMPYPNLNAIVKDFATYRDNGVNGMFAQGNGDGLGGDVAELKAWVVSKLMWDPYQDAEALINEFVEEYYGPAAPAMKKYIGVQRKLAAQPNIHASLYCHPNAGYMDAALLKKMDFALKKAEEAAAGSPKSADRVRRERLAYLYVQVTAPELFDPDHFPEGADPEAMLTLFEHFKSELEHFGITRLHELEDIEVSLNRLKNKLPGSQ